MQRPERIRAVKLAPNKPAEEVILTNTLEGLQAAVAEGADYGMIEFVRLYKEAILNGIMLADDNGEKDEIVLCAGVEFVDLEKLRREYADHLYSAGSSFLDSTGAGEDHDTVDGDSMALGAGVEFDDISDWIKDEEPEAATVDEADTVAAEEEASETKEKKPAAKKKNTKTGTVKNNATTRKNKSSKAGTK